MPISGNWQLPAAPKAQEPPALAAEHVSPPADGQALTGDAHGPKAAAATRAPRISVRTVNAPRSASSRLLDLPDEIEDGGRPYPESDVGDVDDCHRCPRLRGEIGHVQHTTVGCRLSTVTAFRPVQPPTSPPQFFSPNQNECTGPHFIRRTRGTPAPLAHHAEAFLLDALDGLLLTDAPGFTENQRPAKSVSPELLRTTAGRENMDDVEDFNSSDTRWRSAQSTVMDLEGCKIVHEPSCALEVRLISSVFLDTMASHYLERYGSKNASGRKT